MVWIRIFGEVKKIGKSEVVNKIRIYKYDVMMSLPLNLFIYMLDQEEVVFGIFKDEHDPSQIAFRTIHQPGLQSNLFFFPDEVSPMHQIYNDQLLGEMSSAANNSTAPPVDNYAVQPAAKIPTEKRKYDRPRKSDKPKKENKTKNFLPFFKCRHREYLKLYCEKHKIGNIKNHPILKRIFYNYKEKKSKKGKERLEQQGRQDGNDGEGGKEGNGGKEVGYDSNMSMQDFEEIYRMDELADCWKSMFQCRYLYRGMMLGRALLEQKLEYNKRIYVFEEAFITKRFENIR